MSRQADLVVWGRFRCDRAVIRARELGLSVLLVEEDRVGGTCLHRGCIPTKALLHTAELADSVRAGDSVGVQASLDGIDVAGMHRYKDGVVGKPYQGLQGLLGARRRGGFGARPVMGPGEAPLGTRCCAANTWCWRRGRRRGRCPASRWRPGAD